MKNSKATDTLKFLAIHNSWRRGDETSEMQNPTDIGAAIDDAINLLSKYDELETEVHEQCVLNGKGAEREAALLGKVERLERENKRLHSALKGIILYDPLYKDDPWPKMLAGTALNKSY